MPLPVLDPDVTYLLELKKDKQEVRDYLAGVRLIDDALQRIRDFGPYAKPRELQRLRQTYINATIKCSGLLSIIEQRYFHPML